MYQKQFHHFHHPKQFYPSSKDIFPHPYSFIPIFPEPFTIPSSETNATLDSSTTLPFPSRHSFLNKKQYSKIRNKTIKELKQITIKYSLLPKTFYLSVTYLDSICSKMNSFEEIHTLALFCLILAVKFTETGNKACHVVNAFKHKLSCDFLGDEFFILKYLNFHLNMLTLYDVVLHLQLKGVVFDIEKVSNKKLLVLYDTINKTTLSIIEHKIVLDIPMQMLSFGVVGFCRRLIGLDALTQELLVFHGYDLSKMDELNECVNKVERCFRVRKVHNSCCSTGKNVQKELTAPNTPNTSDSDTFEETNVGGKCKEHSVIINNSCCSCGNASSNVFVL